MVDIRYIKFAFRDYPRWQAFSERVFYCGDVKCNIRPTLYQGYFYLLYFNGNCSSNIKCKFVHEEKFSNSVVIVVPISSLL